MGRSEALRIVSDAAPLRAAGPLVEGLTWEAGGAVDLPRALRGLARIVDSGLCHRCGSCVGICPTKVLGLDAEAYPTVAQLSACTDCDLCVKVCPGEEFPYAEAHQQVFGTPGNLLETHGHFDRGVIAHAGDSELRTNSTSGGLVSALLIDLLEHQEIDGAVIIASDTNELWKGRPMVARTKAEILAAAKSKYAISPTNVCLQEIRERPGRYAVVGLPCQIHGIVKACALDARVRERIVVTIGLYCHAAIEHQAFRVIWESLGERTKGAKRFISRIGKHPGTPHLELSDGSLYPVYFGEKRGYRPSSIEVINILYRLFTPARCLTCFDASAEFADIAVGDPWMAPPEDDVDFFQGWSFGLVRSERGRAIYDQAVARGAIQSRTLTERETRRCNIIMSTEKRWRAFRVIETQKRQGKSVPVYGNYDTIFPRHSGKQFIETELHMLSHLFCFLPRWRARLLRFFLGSGGYALFWLNHKRRSLRFWWRDGREWLRRRLRGRS